MSDALWAARLVLKSGTPPTLLDTETIRAICEAYVEAEERAAASATRALFAQLDDSKRDELAAAKLRIVELEALCREEVLKERERCEAIVADLIGEDDIDGVEVLRAIRVTP